MSPGDESSDKLPSEPDEGEEDKEIMEAEGNISDLQNKYTPRDSSRREVSFDVKTQKSPGKSPEKSPEKYESRMTFQSTPG